MKRAAPLLVSLLLAACEKATVQVVQVDVGMVESTATSIEPGVVKSRQDSTLSPPVSGRIVEIYHEEGDRVKKDEPLIRVENDIERIALEEAQLDLERLESLNPVGAARKELIDSARFAVERARTRYEQTFVRAPFDGVLVELNAHIGEMSYGTMPLDLVLGGGGGGGREKALARVVDDSRLFVEADIDEADYGRLEAGQRARIMVEALGGKALPGRLTRVSQTISTAEGRNRSVRVEIEIDHESDGAGLKNGAYPSPPRLLVGMSADIEIIFERVEGAVRVPTLVVLEGEAEQLTYVVKDGRLERRRVEVGASNWEHSQILEGLGEGEWVVVPTDRRELRPGREVNKVERKEEAGK